MSRYLNPPLTTVHVDAFRLGEQAMEMLLEQEAEEGGARVKRAGHAMRCWPRRWWCAARAAPRRRCRRAAAWDGQRGR